jgi:hypothetical protein
MGKKTEKAEIFCFDTSALVRLHRFYPQAVIPDIWTELDKMFQSGKIISHEFVYEEILPDPKKPDELGKWIEKRETSFKPITQFQLDNVGDVLAKFSKLIDPNNEKNQADPWLIAMMREFKEQEESGLFPDETIYYLVTEESISKDNRIPAACREYGVNHLTLFEFFGKMEWKLGLK